MTPTTPSPISPVKEFEAICDLIPEDAYWGIPLTPDLVRHIRDCSTAPTTGSAPVAFYRDVQYDGSGDVQREYNGINEFSGGGTGFPLYDRPASPAASVPSDEQIETAATHIWDHFGPDHEMEWKEAANKGTYRSAARAALLAASMGGEPK